MQDGGGGFQVVGGTIRKCVETIQDAGGADANAAGKFRSWTAPFRARSPAFRALPMLSTRRRDNSGRWRRHSARRLNESEVGRANSGRRRGQCERCRKIPVVDGAIRCACAGILSAVSLDRDVGGTIQDGGAGSQVVGGRIRKGVERIRLPVAAVLPAGGKPYSLSGRVRTRPTKARISAVASGSGRSECARKWTAVAKRSSCYLTPKPMLGS
jgi:hypothetical protein